MDDQAPTLEEQMAAQARLRQKADATDSTKAAIGCMTGLGMLVLGIALVAIVTGGILAWWMWLTW